MLTNVKIFVNFCNEIVDDLDQKRLNISEPDDLKVSKKERAAKVKSLPIANEKELVQTGRNSYRRN